MSGFDVLRSLRLGRIKTPVLILSGLSDIEYKVKGLGFGADDYLTGPEHHLDTFGDRGIVLNEKETHGSLLPKLAYDPLRFDN